MRRSCRPTTTTDLKAKGRPIVSEAIRTSLVVTTGVDWHQPYLNAGSAQASAEAASVGEPWAKASGKSDHIDARRSEARAIFGSLALKSRDSFVQGRRSGPDRWRRARAESGSKAPSLEKLVAVSNTIFLPGWC